MEVCRLCLNLLEEKTFSKVSEPYKCIINNVIPEAELDVTANPVICYNCSILIDELNKFKLLCYDSQQKLLLKGVGKEQLKLTVKEILGNCKKNSTKEQICRTCLGPIDCESFTVLIPSNPDAYLDSMLIMCLPELDLSISRDPVMCKKCLGYLQKLHQLKRACLDIEEELRRHKLQRGNETVDLCAVVAERLVKKSFDMSGIHVKSEVDDEALMEDEEAAIVVKEEQINVKMEELDYSEAEVQEVASRKSTKLDKIMKEVFKNHKQEIHYSCSQCAFTMANKKYTHAGHTHHIY